MQERRGIVPKKLNDKQVSELVIEHANGTSISALAKKYGIARNTVKAYISSNCNYGNFAIKSPMVNCHTQPEQFLPRAYSP